MYKKAWCTCKIVVLLIKPIAFVAFPLPSPSSDLKVPNVSYSHPTYHVNAIKLIWEIVWTGGLPHLSRLPHLFGVPHLHVNRPLLDKRLWCSGHKKYLLCKWRILICLCATISCVGIWKKPAYRYRTGSQSYRRYQAWNSVQRKLYCVTAPCIK